MKAIPSILDAQVRHARHYERVLRSVEDLYVRSGSTARALALLDSELSNIRAGQRWAEEHGGFEGGPPEAGLLSMDYANAGRRVLLLRLPHREYIKWQKSARDFSRGLYPVINRSPQERAAYLLNEMMNLNNVALAHEALGEPYPASLRFKTALEYADKLGEVEGDIDVERELALGGLARTYAVMDNGTKAIEALKFYERRLALARKLGNWRGEAEVMIGIGFIGTGLGKERNAIKLFDGALAIARELDDLHLQREALTRLGDAYFGLRKLPRAIESFREGAEIAGEIGVSGSQAEALYHMSRMYERLGDRERAIESSTASLKAIWLVRKEEDPLTVVKLIRWNDRLIKPPKPPGQLRKWWESLRGTKPRP